MQDEDLTYQIIGSAMKVHTELGPGLREKPCENALTINELVHGWNADVNGFTRIIL